MRTVTITPALIGGEVRDARKELGLDQQIVADLAGVSVRFLRSLEQGKASVQLDHVLRVLHVLGLDLAVVAQHGVRWSSRAASP